MQIEVRFPLLNDLVSQPKLTIQRIVRKDKPWGALAILFSAAFILMSSGCMGGYNSSNQPATNNGVSVSPSSATIPVNGTQQFTATVGGTTGGSVKWSTNGGSVSTTGMYTAPSFTGTWTITATSSTDSTKTGTATINVTSSSPGPTPTPGPGGINVAVGPSPVFVAPGAQQQFTATVTGTSNTGVNWTASAGTINSSGLFTAPNSSATVTVTATSMADTTKSGAATVSVATQDPSVNSWTNRIAGSNVPGGSASVISFQSFDSFPVTNTQQYFKFYDQQSITTDCSIAADGCSLKFAILVGYPQGEPGWFDWNFSPDLSKTFGNGQEFFVQYRERLDPGMLNGANFPNGEGFKSDIITEGDTATVQAQDCSNSPGEVVMVQDGNGAAYPVLYHNCGFSGGTLAFMQSGYELIQLGGVTGSNFLDQNIAGCPHYSGRGVPITDPTCWNYVGNEWFTVQVHVKVGTFQNPNSVLEFWLAHQGQPAQLITNAADAALVNDGTGAASGKYGKIQLSAYNTNMSGSMVNTAVWFDDLVVSTRRIPDPNVATPNPPDSLSLSNISASSVTVNWRVNSHNGTAQDDTGFLVERCAGDGAACFPNPQSGFTQIGTTSAGASSFVDNTVAAGTTYTYRVRAKNSTGNSGYAAAQCFNGGTTCGGTVAVP
jgi:hypothetical protein